MKNVNAAIEIVADLILARNVGANFTKKEFAAKHDISPRTLSRYEAKYYDKAAEAVEGERKAVSELKDGLAKAAKEDALIDEAVADLVESHNKADSIMRAYNMSYAEKTAAHNNDIDEDEKEVVFESTSPEKAPSKKEVAVNIFKEMEGAKRKEVIARFMDEANLTKAGAATYYYNIKKELNS